MPQPVSQEDELRMLYHAVMVTDAKPRMEDLAVRMDLKTGTAAWRWQKLMKRLKEECDGVPPTPATAKATKVKANGTKRKRSPKTEDADDSEPFAKKVEAKSEEPEIKDDCDAADAADATNAGEEDSGNSANSE